MSRSVSRRMFLQAAAAAGPLVGAIRAAEVKDMSKVRLPAEIEPLVQLIENSPRERTIEAVADRVRAGAAYEDVLAAVLLAAVRNVEPRPSVGFKFHAVLVMQSVHLASQAAAPEDRSIPIFWAIDYFKDSQARDERERGWTMGPVDEGSVPARSDATAAFVKAMNTWDEAGADAAIAGLARTGEPDEIWELFFRYGARDYRSIGHKAIDVANSHRVLGAIGWKYVEPVLRSLAYALLMHEEGNPASRDAWPDRPWRRNQELAAKLPDTWEAGKDDPEAVTSLLVTLRTGSENDAADEVVRLIRRGVAPRSIWDALFVGAGELLVRQPGIIALHSVTTTNAIHYTYCLAKEERVRRLLLLQNASFLPMFRQTMQDRGEVREFRLDALEPSAVGLSGPKLVERVFAELDGDPVAAARLTLGHFRSEHKTKSWIDTARRLVIHKGTGPHDYKYGMAVLEDHGHVSARWRPHYMASSVFSLQGTSRPDNSLIARIRTALGR